MILRIREILEDLNLTFLGFIFSHEETGWIYKQKFSEDSNLTDLTLWDKFEEEYPNTFNGIYEFWCQKPEARQ